MSTSRPRSATECRVGVNRTLSWRLAPLVAQPIGIPARSVRIDHFQPKFPPVRRVLARPFAPTRCLVLGAVERDVGEIETDALVVGTDGLVNQAIEDPCLLPLVPPCPQRRIGDLAVDQLFGIHP